MSSLQSTHRLVIVSGKGGVGKSLLAATVAAVSAAQGLKTVLVTLDTREARHPLLDEPLQYRPHRTRYGFSVSRVDAFEAVGEYVRRSMPLGVLYEGFFRSRTFRDFAAAAPGFEELMSLGKLYDLATGSDFQRVVFDAPATGHLKELLAVPRTTQRAVRVGPLNHNARRIEDLLLDPERTHVMVTALAEEMPVREALEVVAHCRDELRMSVGPVLVNRRVRPRFSAAERQALAALARQEGVRSQTREAIRLAQNEQVLAEAQQEALAPLQAAGLACVSVPRVAQRQFDVDELLITAGREMFGTVLPLNHSATTSRSGARRAAAGPAPRPAQAPSAAPSATAAGPLDLDALVATHRVVVCCGSGGVGKTTSAAALGVLAARRGLRVQVMTIDPARRLAQAMGLESLGHDPQRVTLDAPGELWAMMLDAKRAFDRLVEMYAPDAAVREAIFANHYYQQLSSSIGGSRELIAMERVLEMAREDDYDLLIVDTPPSQHALDFLDAPARIVSLLDGSLTSLLVRPYGLAARAQFSLFRQSSAATLKLMERITGVQMLADLSDFLLAFSSMFDGFRERSHQVQALMRESTTAFLLVCSPDPASIRQVDQFANRLSGDGMRIAGVLANRVHALPAGADERAPKPLGYEHDELTRLAAAGDPAFSDLPLPERLAEVWQDALDLHLGDRAALRSLEADGLPMHRVPRLPEDLHSLADLERFAALLTRRGAGEGPQP